MDPNTIILLCILGFEDLVKLPLMRELQAQYKKMSKVRHPDKPGGTTEDFQELLNAYHSIGRLIEKEANEQPDDEEEVVARNMFKQFNFEKENSYSFTISIKNCEYLSWEEVFTKHFGVPVDKSATSNGKKFTIAFKMDDDLPECRLYATLYFKPKSASGTLYIQSEKSKHYVSSAFVSNALPGLYLEVLDIQSTSSAKNAIDTKKKSDRPTTKTTRKAPESKTKSGDKVKVKQASAKSVKKETEKLSIPEEEKPSKPMKKVMPKPSISAEVKLTTVSSLVVEEVHSSNNELENLSKETEFKKEEEKEKILRTDDKTLSSQVEERFPLNEAEIRGDYDKSGVEQTSIPVVEDPDKESEMIVDEVEVLNPSVSTDQVSAEGKQNLISSLVVEEVQSSSPKVENPCKEPEFRKEEEKDLSPSVGKDQIMCIVCGLGFPTGYHLEYHTQTSHPKSEPKPSFNFHKEVETSPTLQNPKKRRRAAGKTISAQCDQCPINLKKVEQFNLLEKEYIEVKSYYEHYHKTSNDQGLMMSNLQEELLKVKTENSRLTLELLKEVKEKSKVSKDNKSKMKEMEEELKKSYDKANELFQENLVLIEEKRVDDEIKKINEELKKKRDEELLMQEETNHTSDEDAMDEEINEAEAAAFMKQQPRSSRSSPMFDAKPDDNQNRNVVCNICNFKAKNVTQLRGHLTGHPKCNVCNLTFKTVGLVKRHLKEEHNIQPEKHTNENKSSHTDYKLFCSKCDFMAKTNIQMEKHVKLMHNKEQPIACDRCEFITTNKTNLTWHKEAMHSSEEIYQQKNQNIRKVSQPCSFWLNGFCRYSEQECRFSHRNVIQCRYQMDCRAWPDCRFAHDETPACYFQENCLNYNCPFEHYSGNENHFLGNVQVPKMNFQNFPPLNQARNGKKPWRPW